MKKVFRNRVVAWLVLVLTVALACFLGFSRKAWFEEKKKTELLKVNKDNWVCDNAELLSAETKHDVMERDRVWEGTYNTTVAVATLPKLNRWTVDDYAVALGKKWGLDENAMLLLLVKDDAQCYLAAGANINAKLSSQDKKDVITTIYTHINDADYDGAVTSFLDWADTRITSAQLPITSEDFDLGSVFSAILPFSLGCSGTSFKTIFIVIVVILVISALSKGGRRHYSPSGERPTRSHVNTPVHGQTNNRPVNNGPRPAYGSSRASRPEGAQRYSARVRTYSSSGKNRQ